jgi:hypothetical protein
MRGFRPDRAGFGALWAAGIYCALDEPTAVLYEDFSGFCGKAWQRLELRVKVASPLRVDVEQIPRTIKGGKIIWDAAGAVLASVPGALAEYRLRCTEKQGGAALLSELVRRAGYDALVLANASIDTAFGGNQAILFEPTQATVVAVGEPGPPRPRPFRDPNSSSPGEIRTVAEVARPTVRS